MATLQTTSLVKIIEYQDCYAAELQDLLVELQEHIVALDQEHLNFVGPDFREKYFAKTLNAVRQKQGKIFLAQKDQIIVGGIVVYLVQYQADDRIEYTCPKQAFISDFIVKKQYRHAGVGAMLLDYAENYFRHIGCQYVGLELFAGNDHAAELYQKRQYANRYCHLLKKL